MKADYRAGYLYVLAHPSDPDLYKIGVTVLRPEKRLAQHNSHGGVLLFCCSSTSGSAQLGTQDTPRQTL